MAFEHGSGVLAGFGASHSCTTLMHHFDLAHLLDYVVDDNPHKQGRLTPGSHLEVLPPSELSAPVLEEMPDYTVILPWRFADMIMAKHHAYTEAGGRWIVPVPEVRIL